MRYLQDDHELRTCCHIASHTPIRSSEQAARSESKEEVISEGEERHDPSPPPWAERGEAKENTKDETNDTEDAEETKETGIPTVVDPRAKFAQKKADLLLLLDDIYDGMLFRKVG